MSKIGKQIVSSLREYAEVSPFLRDFGVLAKLREEFPAAVLAIRLGDRNQKLMLTATFMRGKKALVVRSDWFGILNLPNRACLSLEVDNAIIDMRQRFLERVLQLPSPDKFPGVYEILGRYLGKTQFTPTGEFRAPWLREWFFDPAEMHGMLAAGGDTQPADARFILTHEKDRAA